GGGRDGGADVVGIGHVGLDEAAAEVGGDLLALGRVAVEDDDGRARSREPPGGCLTHPGGAAGHDRGGVRKLHTAEARGCGNAGARPVVAVPVAAVEPSCFEVLALIQRYADGECETSSMLAISSHLDRCGHCACELESLRLLKAAVRRCHRAPES